MRKPMFPARLLPPLRSHHPASLPGLPALILLTTSTQFLRNLA